MEWLDSKQLKIDPPKRTKKITGTRFATILGLNPWSTPFEIWCAVTKTFELPFEDTIYTIAGKTIEPKQIAYMKKSYAMDNLRTPTDIFGEDYFNKTLGDFYHDTPILGGMWDSLLVDDDEKPDTVLEFKTTKRSEDWANGVPEYYALQAALYAYLLGVDDVIMVASFLEAKDYDHPEKFKPSSKNTITVEFKVSEKYPNFGEMVEQVKAEVDSAMAAVADKEKRLKTINDIIKEHAIKQFRDGDKKVEVKGGKYTWAVSRSTVKSVDKEALKADGLLAKYEKESTQYRMTVK